MADEKEPSIQPANSNYDIVRNELLRWMPRHSVGAEIGTWKGEYAEKMIEVCQPSHLHLIDPYLFSPEYPARWYGGNIAKSQNDMDRMFHEVRNRLEALAGEDTKITFHRDLSENALTNLIDDELDWAYIDGNHSYEFVKKDLEGLLPKVKSGGFIMGDDIQWDGVNQAVTEFARNYADQVIVVTIRPHAHQYVFKKL